MYLMNTPQERLSEVKCSKSLQSCNMRNMSCIPITPRRNTLSASVIELAAPGQIFKTIGTEKS